MINEHLSEEELQTFAMEQQSRDEKMIQHIESCTSCREQIAVYKVILSGIKEQPAVSFNFDITDIIINQLQPVKTKASASIFSSVIPGLFAAMLVTISLYIFRKNFLNLSTEISATFLVISVITCISVIGFKVIKLYHKYNQQIKKLNLSE